MNGFLAELVLTIVLSMTAIILHELAHGYAAWALGDDTAKAAGRLSLNPIRHIDRVGTVLLPGLLLLGQLLTVGRVLFMFGWAKPVPVAAWKFRDPRRMMALVAIAGPLMNVALAFGAALVLRDRALPPVLVDAALTFIAINLVLALFNMLPLPPLDGGRIVVGLLPAGLAVQWAKLERFGIVVVLLLIAAPALLRQGGIAFDPLHDTLDPALRWTMDLLLRAAGAADPDASVSL